MTALAEIAEERDGIVPAAAAREAGISGVALVKLAARGHLDRLGRGVYRWNLYPASAARNAELHEALAIVQAGHGPAAVISHESALQAWGLSDALPAQIHVTIPPEVRLRRTIPPTYRLHRATFGPTDIVHRGALPVTSVVRTIRDVIASGRRDLALQAIRDGVADGQLTQTQASQLRRAAGE